MKKTTILELLGGVVCLVGGGFLLVFGGIDVACDTIANARPEAQERYLKAMKEAWNTNEE